MLFLLQSKTTGWWVNLRKCGWSIVSQVWLLRITLPISHSLYLEYHPLHESNKRFPCGSSHFSSLLINPLHPGHTPTYSAHFLGSPHCITHFLCHPVINLLENSQRPLLRLPKGITVACINQDSTSIPWTIPSYTINPFYLQFCTIGLL